MARLILFYGACVLSVLYPVTAFPCLDIEGEWQGSYNDVPYCDGYRYSGSWRGTVSANCDFRAVEDEGTVVLGSVNRSTRIVNAFGQDDECGRVTVTGTFASNTVSGTYSFEGYGGGTFSGSLSNPTADLTITKSDSADPVMIEDPFRYTLRVTNSGPNTATSVQAKDTLPVGVTYVGASGSGWNCTGSNLTVTCSRSSLGLTTAPDITIQVSAPASAGTVTNSATVSAATYDPNSNNDSTNVATTITLPSANEGVIFTIINAILLEE